MPELTDLQEKTVRRRNWAPWIALLLALAAMFSNAGFFIALPGQRAIAWLGVALVVAAIVCAVIGILRAFRQSQVYGGKVSSSILGVVSLLICGVVAFGAIHSRDLPSSAAAPQVGQKVPDFTLADTSGNKVSLDQLLGKEHVALVMSPDDLAKLRMAHNLLPVGAGAATPTKAVLLVFYRGYW